MVKNYGIHDEWKDLNKVNDIDIKSIDGVIDSIKVNGEEAGGGGSSDFSTATVTIDNTTRTSINCAVPVISEELEGACKAIARITGEDYLVNTVPLYKGKALLMFQGGTISVTGAIDGSLGGGAFVVTGDGSITIA